MVRLDRNYAQLKTTLNYQSSIYFYLAALGLCAPLDGLVRLARAVLGLLAAPFIDCFFMPGSRDVFDGKSPLASIAATTACGGFCGLDGKSLFVVSTSSSSSMK